MEVTKVKAGKQLKLFVEGRVDTTTAPQLEKEISGDLDSVESVVIDCLKLSYISSAGLRLLLSTKKKVNDLTLVHVNETIMEVLEMTGFDTLLTIKK